MDDATFTTQPLTPIVQNMLYFQNLCLESLNKECEAAPLIQKYRLHSLPADCHFGNHFLKKLKVKYSKTP